MGYNSTVIVMNDALGAIKEDPEFGKNLALAIYKVQRGDLVDVPASGEYHHCPNAATVIETHHADGYSVIAAGGNTAINLGIHFPYGGDNKEVNLLKNLADSLGYTVRKKPVKK